MPQFPAVLDLDRLDEATGFEITVKSTPFSNQMSFGAAGDVNGDGIGDFIVGVFDNHDQNTAHIVFGRAGGFADTLHLPDLDGINGFKVSGGAYTGHSVAGAGDINGDGFDDLIIGAHRNSAPGALYSGASYVVFGKASPFSANLNPASLNGTNGFKINGEAEGDWSGYSVASAGDVNNDGFDDLLIGARFANRSSLTYGASYVVFGKASGFGANLDLSSLNGSNGFQLDGPTGFGTAFAVSGAGDVNGDGFDDVIIALRGAVNQNNFSYEQFSGGAYVVFGKAGGFGANVALANLSGSDGFKITGAWIRPTKDPTVSGAGDVNGDGFDDIVIGAPGADNADGGHAHIVYGKGSGFSAVLDVRNLDGSNGFTLLGPLSPPIVIGYSVSSGDVDNDGFSDIILNGSFVVFGKSTSFGPTFRLTNIEGAQGFRIEDGGFAGSIGDINGDGNSDIITGSHVVYGNYPDLQFPNTVELSSLNGPTGFQINGVSAGDYAGFSVNFAGDVNGDAIPDLIIGAPNATLGGAHRGASYVVFGKTSGFGANFELSDLSGANGFRVDGTTIDSQAGRSVSSAGDINGDGLGDLIIGAPRQAGPNGSESGIAYVVFGRTSGFPAVLDPASLGGGNGFRIAGEHAGDFAGFSVGSAGDINGDGFADLIIGAPYDDANGNQTGSSYVIFGKASGFSADLDLSSLNGSNGFKIKGEFPDDWSGFSVASAGDVNGDGFKDIIVGAPLTGSQDQGASYVVFGKSGGFAASIELSSLTGSNGFQFNGANRTLTGFSVISAGDFNSDGFDDLIVGAPGPERQNFAGNAYLIYGKGSGFAADLNVGSLNGTPGFQIHGEANGDLAGFSVAGAGDINGDGFDDLVIGTYYAGPDGAESGVSYVVFGTAAALSSSFQLSKIDGHNGFKLDGEMSRDGSGFSISSAGDINGDGFGDLIIGSPGADPHGASSGAAHVAFGRKPEVAVNRTGTGIAQTLAGGDFDDTLMGLGGDDLLFGGAGIDTARFSGARSAYVINLLAGTVSGPEGIDTLSGIERLKFSDKTLDIINFTTGNPALYMAPIRDFDGNYLGGVSGWKLIGSADVQNDGDLEFVFVDRAIGRWATVGPDSSGLVDFGRHGSGGDTRVVGIYIDPLVQSGAVVQFGPHDSQRRFQNDLNIENINRILGAGDYDGDGLQEIYFALTDGTAYLHAYMHADGNIRYANYQSEQQVKDYLNGHGFGAGTWGSWFPPSLHADAEASIGIDSFWPTSDLGSL